MEDEIVNGFPILIKKCFSKVVKRGNILLLGYLIV